MKYFSLLLAVSLVMPYPSLAQEDMRLTDNTARFLAEFDTRDMWRTLNQTDDSLYDYLEQSYRANPILFAARAELMAVQENLAQAQSGYLPQITADADTAYSYTDSDGSEFVSSNGGNFGFGAGVTLQQPLYRGGQTTAKIDGVNYNIAAQQFKLSQAEQDIILQAVTAYMTLYRDQAILDLQKNNALLVAKELDQARARFDVGELTITDVSQSEARLAQAKSGVIQAQTNLDAAMADFIAIVGAAPNEEKLLYPNIIFEIPNTLEGAVELALSNNREVVQARFNKQAAKADKRIVEGELKPSVSASSSVSQRYSPSEFIDDQRQLTMGVNASMPLYMGGATRARIRQADKVVLQRDAQIEAIQNQVKASVRANWAQWQAAKALTASLEKQIEASRIAQEGVQYEIEFGERTTLDALNANQELLSAQTDMISAKANEVIAYFTLAESLGVLIPDNLGFESLVIQ